MKKIGKLYLLIFGFTLATCSFLIFLSIRMISANSKYESEWYNIKIDMLVILSAGYDKFYDFDFSRAVFRNNNEYCLKALVKRTSSSNYESIIIIVTDKDFKNNTMSIYYEDTIGYLIMSAAFSSNAKNVKEIPHSVIFTDYVYNPIIPNLFIIVSLVLLLFSTLGLFKYRKYKTSKKY